MKLNDPTIRSNFHKKILQKYHNDNNILVIDELGLNHGKNRADIAVVNGHMIGYEIKSDEDNLSRFNQQVKSYNEIFDKINIVVGLKHFKNICKIAPEWWGIILVDIGLNNNVKFNIIRKSIQNENISPISIAKLLWREEVIKLLKTKKVSSSYFRLPRTHLYEILVNNMSTNELRKSVRNSLKNRKNWRDQ